MAGQRTSDVSSFDLSKTALGQWLGSANALGDLATPTLRLGVTGLSRAGKTVFITALVRNLVREARLPFFSATVEGRLERAYLEPQPDDDIPRFAYEEHLAALAKSPPEWPESTRRISELRVTLEYRSGLPLWRHLGTNRLHVDIVDYPGEWLIDLPLLAQGYADWARQALAAARLPGRRKAAAEFLAFVASCPGASPQDEQKALAGARLFRDYLIAERRSGLFEPTLGPGRFLLPGELEGSPLLTFLPLDEDAGAGRGSMREMMTRRFEAYRNHVVKPFFRNHFARLDRQIVLVDALSAIDRGPSALGELETTLASVLSCFRVGSSGLLDLFRPRRIDRILFAATKADHVPRTSHDRLEAILEGLTRRAAERAEFSGAEVKSIAIAALRATQEAELKRGSGEAALVGVPLPGERIGREAFDGLRRAALYPGDLPATLEAALAAAEPSGAERDIALVRFRPTRIAPDVGDGSAAPWPHIRLDRALEFLVGDRLA
ncbi:MAG: YcjX family protein [Proteobacteria bacterium]|nr:YcjX family protein [Pseudomonadota bacterium]